MTAVSLDQTGGDLVSIDVTAAGPTVLVTVAGEVDSSSSPALRSAIQPALSDAVEELTVDLCAVTFLDSAGLCVLAATHRQATERGIRLRVLAAGRPVVRPLQITGLWNLLGVEDCGSGDDPAA